MSFRCSVCRKEHNSLLHVDRQTPLDSTGQGNSGNADDRVTTFGSINENINNVLLPTVKVKIRTKRGDYITARGLLDTGSQISLVTSRLVSKLNLKTFNNNVNILGISENITNVQKAVNLKIESCVFDYSTNIKCSVVDKITSDIPQTNFNVSNLNIPKNIKLSDDDFNKSGTIDILFGANISFHILLSDKIQVDQIILQNTLFGFIVSGSAPSLQICNFSAFHLSMKNNLENIVSQFWETEKVPEIFPEYSTEQEACEINFENSLQVINNKYQVKLPLKQNLPDLDLGDSFSVALKRFENLEKRFKVNPELYSQYKSFIDEYLALKHAK